MMIPSTTLRIQIGDMSKGEDLMLINPRQAIRLMTWDTLKHTIPTEIFWSDLE